MGRPAAEPLPGPSHASEDVQTPTSTKKIQEILDADKIMTRAKRFKQYGNFSKPKQDKVALGAKIQDFIERMCFESSCLCHLQKSTLQIFQKNAGRKGLAESLYMSCSNCSSNTGFFSSKKFLTRGDSK